MSVTALAEAAGVSRQSVTYYEAGSSSPQPETLAALSSALSVPENYFVRSFEPVIAPAIHFRSLKKTPKKARLSAQVKTNWIARIARYLDQFIELPAVNIPQLDRTDPRSLNLTDIDVMAGDVRRMWGLGDGPISDLYLLLENQGVVVSSFPLSNDLISGFSLWEENLDRPFVTVNNRLRKPTKSRFDAAHELGHMVLHRHITERDQRDSGLYDLMETQAHRFANSFLMPDSSFLRDFSHPSLHVFESLKPKWKTSIKAMIYKAGNAGLLSNDGLRSLYIEYAQRWGQAEPHDGPEYLEEPRLLSRSILLLGSEGIATEREVCEEVALSPFELRQLAALPKPVQDDDSYRATRPRNSMSLAPSRPSRNRYR